MIDAATLKFPYRPASGYTKEYLGSREDIHVEMAARLDDFSALDGGASMLLTGVAGRGKTTMLHELRDITNRRHGGYPNLELEVKPGRSIYKSMSDQMLAYLARPEYKQRDLVELRKAIGMVGELATGSAAGSYEKPQMHKRLWAMGLAMKAARLPFVFFIDDVQELSRLDLASLAHSTNMMQREALPLMFVLAGLPSVFHTLCDFRDDAGMLFNPYPLKRRG